MVSPIGFEPTTCGLGTRYKSLSARQIRSNADWLTQCDSVHQRRLSHREIWDAESNLTNQRRSLSQRSHKRLLLVSDGNSIFLVEALSTPVSWDGIWWRIRLSLIEKIVHRNAKTSCQPENEQRGAPTLERRAIFYA